MSCIKKFINRFIAVGLVIILFSPFFLKVVADYDENTKKEFENIDEKVYYSDLFYEYSSYLETGFIKEHYYDTQFFFNQAFCDYMDSPSFAWSNIRSSLDKAFNIKEWCKTISDAAGLSTFTYDKALDAANAEFASKMFGESELVNTYKKEEKVVKKIKDILNVYDTFDKNYDVSQLSETEIFTAMFATIEDVGNISYISKTTLTELKEDILPHISDITSSLKYGSDILTAAQTVATGIMLEDFRIGIIDDILSNAPAESTIYSGMSRLKKQLRNGFKSYFLDNYLTEKVLNELADNVVKKIAEYALSDQTGSYALIGAVYKVVSWVAFDKIFQVPEIDDLTKQIVLSEYASDLYGLAQKEMDVFSRPFKSESIEVFETVMGAYEAAVKAAFSATEKIVISTNRNQYEILSSKYKDANLYSCYIKDLIDYIKTIPQADRTITAFGTWNVGNKTILQGPSDEIESGNIYCPISGLNADIVVNVDGSMIIQEDAEATITGDISSNGYIENNGKLNVQGNFTNETGYYDGCPSGKLRNNGEMSVSGSIKAIGDQCDIYQDQESAVLRIGGDFIGNSRVNISKITAGTVVFNGTTEQKVASLKACNVESTNTEGIIYTGNVEVSGHFNLNGNPLNSNGYQTFIYNGVSFDSVSDYGDVCVPGYTIVNLCSGFHGNLRVYVDGSLKIPEGADVTITGDISSNGYIENNGKLNVQGNFTNETGYYDGCPSGKLRNNGEMSVSGSIKAIGDQCDIYQDQESAVLRIGGDFIGNSRVNISKITAGTVVFNGNNCQTITSFRAPTVVLLNKSDDGVIFTTAINPSVLFNHNGNHFSVTAGSKFADYDGDGLKDDVDPSPTVFNPEPSIVSFGTCGEKLIWTLDEDGLLTISGTGSMANYSIEDIRWDDHSSDIKKIIIDDGVTSIGDYAFSFCTELASVTIPGSVESIGNYGFYACLNLTNVTLPEGITSIGCEAFGGYCGLTGITIPDSVISIGDLAFDQCYKLTSITIPKNVASIGAGVFKGCENLASIGVSESNAYYISKDGVLFDKNETNLIAYPPKRGALSYDIPSTVTNIEDYAFYYCTNVGTVTIPSGVTKIGQGNFVNSSFSSINVANSNGYYCSIDGVLFSKDGKDLLAYPRGKEASSYIIPNGVTSIGWMAFGNCNKLESVTIPNTVTALSDYAFYSCNKLSSVTIPKSVVSIGEEAFGSCWELTSVTFLSSLENFGYYIFEDCNSITDVYYSGTEEQWDILKDSFIYGNENLFAATLHFITTPETISDFSVAHPTAASITAPEGGWVIGENTFSVAAERPCVLAVSYDGGQTYTRLKASANDDGSYSFDVNIADENTSIVCAYKGDVNGNGSITSADYAMTKAAFLGKTKASPLNNLCADVNGNGSITSADYAMIKAAFLGKINISW